MGPLLVCRAHEPHGVPDSGKGGEREGGGVDQGPRVVDEVLAENGRSNQYRPLMRDSLCMVREWVDMMQGLC